MGFLDWLGFSKPRDAPEGAPENKPGLPEVTDSVRDSGSLEIISGLLRSRMILLFCKGLKICGLFNKLEGGILYV